MFPVVWWSFSRSGLGLPGVVWARNLRAVGSVCHWGMDPMRAREGWSAPYNRYDLGSRTQLKLILHMFVCAGNLFKALQHLPDRVKVRWHARRTLKPDHMPGFRSLNEGQRPTSSSGSFLAPRVTCLLQPMSFEWQHILPGTQGARMFSHGDTPFRFFWVALRGPSGVAIYPGPD